MNEKTQAQNQAKAPTVMIEEEMRRSYLDYAMSVIVSRALPDVRDGLKPVHRRILYAMKEGGYDVGKPYRKSARIVGEVMGKYHPHGDAAIYDSMVRLAQDFAMRMPLVDGQGNFGSMDGDPPAAMRYTEARLAKASEPLLRDIDQDTVNFVPNYDGTLDEPQVLPAAFPALLVNGGGGIAVGMATNIPPHNLGEVIDACLAMIDDPEISTAALVGHIKGPDFPTGGLIIGQRGIQEAQSSGRGSIIMRARSTIEEGKRTRIIFNEIPYQVNKARLIERIAEVVREKTVEGIADLRDESNREGVRIVVELKREAHAEVILNQLLRHTPLQTTFPVNSVVLQAGRPQIMNLREILQAFLSFREEVIARRTRFILGKASARAQLLIALTVAVDNIDDIVNLIRSSKDAEQAQGRLLAQAWPARGIAPLLKRIDEDLGKGQTYRLTSDQAKAILDLRLHRLTTLEREKLTDELDDTIAEIKDCRDILAKRSRVLDIIRHELKDIAKRFATPRRTEIIDHEETHDIEDLVQREEMVVTVSNAGYVKRVALDTYRAQRRGGKGRTGATTRDQDFVTDLFVANTHTMIQFFTSRGQVYQLKVYVLPAGTPQSRGKALINLLPLRSSEAVTTVLPLPDPSTKGYEDLNIVFATASGGIRRNKISDFARINRGGKIAMKLKDGDRLIGVVLARDDQEVLLATRLGRSVRFHLGEQVRVFSGRTSTGVRAVRLSKGDEVISLTALSGNPDEQILTISEQGFGKITKAKEYRITARGGGGVKNMTLGTKNRAVVASFAVEDSDEIMLASDKGQVIRCPVNDIRKTGRTAMGVNIFTIDEDERVVSVAKIAEKDDEESAKKLL
ncbi:MAG: DNA gyrase subunit A [Pseudomonadota bacterium]